MANDILLPFDPDVNIFNCLNPTLFQSPLVSPADLHLRFPPANYFSLLHINIRSLFNKMTQLNVLLTELNQHFSIICISETWLDDSSASLISLPNYKFVFNNRINKTGGGVGLFICDKYNFVLRNDLCPANDTFEWLAVEIISNSSSNMIIYVVYRPPNTDPIYFTTQLSLSINHRSMINKTIYIIGDFNINLFQNDINTISSQFTNSLYCLNLIPLITSPTRVTDHSSTLIDNIFTNNLIEHTSAVLKYDISDHFPICTIFDYLPIIEKPNTHQKYLFTDSNILALNTYLSNQNWQNVLLSNDVNIASSCLIETLQCGLKSHCLFQVKHRRRRKQPWITLGLLKSSSKKNKLYNKFFKSPTLINKSAYNVYKNCFNTLCKIAKTNYYANEFSKNVNNVKKTWELIKTNLNNFKPINNSIKLKVNNELITNKEQISNIFNNQFASSGLNSTPDQLIFTHKNFLINSCPRSLSLLNADPNEIQSLINNCSNTSSTGDDGIPNNLLKKISANIISPLTHIINLSLNLGQFPSIFKVSKITPVFKNGCETDSNNYRPISLLSSISKLFEKIVYNRLSGFLEKENILSPRQYGFTKHGSTELAILDLTQYISLGIESRLHTMGVFVDFSKAFDTIDHSILLDKLLHYGVRGLSHDWFASYLNDRTQYVCLENTKSDPISTYRGVPQGSILGPLLFNIYINDIVNISKCSKFILFADDTTILLQDKNITNLTNNFNSILQCLNSWCSANELKINFNKTCCMLFGPKIVTNIIKFSLTLNGIPVIRVNSTKFLGIYITSNLSWLDKILYISKKISKSFGILNKLKHTLPFHIIKLLYNSLIQPYLTYCLPVWGNSCKSHITILSFSQNNFLRILYKLKLRDHTSHLYNLTNIMNLHQMFQLKMLLLIHKLITKNFSPYFSCMMNTFSHSSRRILRFNFDFNFKPPRTTLYLNSPIIVGLQLWNKVPTAVKNFSTTSMFKRSIKSLILNNFFES